MADAKGIGSHYPENKSKALEELAEERLRDYAIEFKDGKIACTNPKNITVFACETSEDEEDEK